ncbi:Gfo/Idh/MocA family protein [Amycolatopsis suaedae]|uniref:Gfo/Idh/MocA family oxidoreductase n=1 Tax=Amycolatopsis suaedae TaxID=2510978 RepID=A0A4Q7J1U7_9PSEU|nr:Gfo/Idh/MocA family oxidoreductase [Amycolatopsis suaedae]RZQ61390.1 Gfo/Idh/MocA family oxidoreductase [Amycolatopsis suaedae]
MRVGLAGVSGYGHWHLENIRRLAALDVVELAGLADPADLPGDLPPVPRFRTLDALLDAVAPDIVVIGTPIHTHADLAGAALEAGAHVLLEKPPVAAMADHERLLDTQTRTGKQIQVGLQAMGSAALRRLGALIAAGELGTVRGVGADGAWRRDTAYFRRADWAGRRTLAGRPVTDGALTNPFAHAVQAALWLAGMAGTRPEVELELFHANDIESDDTSCLRATGPGVPVVVAATLCAQRDRPPRVVVHGDAGRAELFYESDELVVDGRRQRFGRTDLLANLVDHAGTGADLLCPLWMTTGLSAVVEAVRTAPAPAALRRWTDDGGVRVVSGVDEWVAAAAERLLLFSELGAGW